MHFSTMKLSLMFESKRILFALELMLKTFRVPLFTLVSRKLAFDPEAKLE